MIGLTMVEVILFGKNISEIKPSVQAAGFKVVEKNAQFIISYGGDGTLMRAEYEYPGIPKIILKDSLICKRCSSLPNEEVLKKVINGKYHIEELMKLEVEVDGRKLYAMNDITMHNKDSRHAIRYSLLVNDRLIGSSIIGDGVVVATPFGSTAYYRSITDSFFELGIGLAFNNSTEQSDHIVLKEDSIIKIQIIRGPAVIYADNQEQELIMDKGAEVTIKKSLLKTAIILPN